MILLGLDCAGAACSAAILDGDRVLARRQEEMARGQAERIVPMIQECLEEAGCRATDLAGVAVTVGPGAFTGVRIGIAAAQGIARTARCPQTGITVAGITVTEALAEPIPTRIGARLCVAIDSRRADPFCEWFEEQAGVWRGKGPEILVGGFDSVPKQDPSQLESLFFAGNLAAAARDALGGGTVLPDHIHPDPVEIARIGQRKLEAGCATPPAPLYLRAPDVSAPSRDKSRRPARS